MYLPDCYHWSPHERYHSILSNGLKPYAQPTVSTSFNPETNKHVIGWPYICLGTDPRSAWALSGDMEYVSEIEEWDLWYVYLGDKDEMQVRLDYGREVKEVRIFNPVPADRLWWVGTRTPRSALEEAIKDE